MARTSKMSFEVSATVSLGNFENVKLHYGEEVTLDPEDSVRGTRESLVRRVKKLVEDEIAEARADAKAATKKRK